MILSAKKFLYSMLSILLLACSNINQENDSPKGSFSETEAEELLNVLTSSDSIENQIIEEITIGTKTAYTDSIWKLVRASSKSH